MAKNEMFINHKGEHQHLLNSFTNGAVNNACRVVQPRFFLFPERSLTEARLICKSGDDNLG